MATSHNPRASSLGSPPVRGRVPGIVGVGVGVGAAGVAADGTVLDGAVFDRPAGGTVEVLGAATGAGGAGDRGGLAAVWTARAPRAEPRTAAVASARTIVSLRVRTTYPPRALDRTAQLGTH